MCPVSAQTRGPVSASSAPSRNTVAPAASSSSTSKGRSVAGRGGGGVGWLSHPSAGMIELVMRGAGAVVGGDELLRGLVEGLHLTAAQQRRHLTRGAVVVGDPAEDVAHRPAPERGGVQQRRQHRRAWASHRSASPAAREVAETMSVARSIAVTGSVQPVSGSKLIVERSPPSPTGLNTNTGPGSSAGSGAQLEQVGAGRGHHRGAGGVEDAAGEPAGLAGAGPPKTRVTSSIEDHTRCSPTRHSSTPTAEVGVAHPSRRTSDASEGRTVLARRRVATVPACRAMSSVEATPARRRDRADQRDTIARLRDQRCHPTSASSARR